jgi:hypothetical protein
MASEPIRHPDGSVEWRCLKCGEPLLMFKGDPITVSVGEGGVVEGVLCNICADEPSKEPTDGR